MLKKTKAQMLIQQLASEVDHLESWKKRCASHEKKISQLEQHLRDLGEAQQLFRVGKHLFLTVEAAQEELESAQEYYDWRYQQCYENFGWCKENDAALEKEINEIKTKIASLRIEATQLNWS